MASEPRGRNMRRLFTLVGLVALAGSYIWLNGCGPLPGDEPYSVRAPREIVTIYTQDPLYFYLVDTRRGLCFFGYRRSPQLTRVDCWEIPEARELLGLYDEEPTDAALEEEMPPPEEGEPEALPEEDPGQPPTAEERTAFEAAYLEYFCAMRKSASESDGPPDKDAIIGSHGLTPERYLQVRGHLAADKEAWSALSQRAFEACP